MEFSNYRQVGVTKRNGSFKLLYGNNVEGSKVCVLELHNTYTTTTTNKSNINSYYRTLI